MPASTVLPSDKTLSSFDFAAVPAISMAHVMALAEADGWLAQGHNLLAFGPPGVGKTHLLAGIGYALIDHGYKVLSVRSSEVVQRLQAARRDLRLPNELYKLDRFDAEDGAPIPVKRATGAQPLPRAHLLSEFFLDGGKPAAPAPEHDAVRIPASDGS